MNISDPDNLSLVNSFDTEGDTYEIIFKDNYAYIADGLGGLRIYDKGNIENIEEVNCLDESIDDIIKDIAVDGEYVYLLGFNDGLHIINASDTSNPEYEGSYHLSDHSWSLAVKEGYAYIGNEGLWIIDVQDPANPTEVGHCETGGYVESDVAVQGNYAYIADNNDHLYIIDVSDKSNPSLKGQFDAGDDLTAVEVQGNYVYIGIDDYDYDQVEKEFRVIDVSDAANPIEVGKYDGWWGFSSLPAGYNRPIMSISVNGSYLYVMNHYMGLGIFDISNPQNPTEVGFYRGGASDMLIEGDYAYIARKDCKIVDISDPSAPQLAGYYEIDDDTYYSRDIAIQSGVVYIKAVNLYIMKIICSNWINENYGRLMEIVFLSDTELKVIFRSVPE